MKRRAFLGHGAGFVALPSIQHAGSARSCDPYGPLGSLVIDGATEVVSGPANHAVLATTDGFAIVDITDPTQPTLVAEQRELLADHEDGPLHAVRDVSVSGTNLLVVGPAHATAGPTAALYYDLSNPAEPNQLTVYETDFPIHNGRLANGHAYLTGNDGEANPMVIIDPDQGTEISRWSPLDANDDWESVHPALRPCHDIWVHGNRTIASYWDAGTWIVDVTDVSNPTALGRIGDRSAATLADIESVGPEAAQLPGNHHSSTTDATGHLLAIGFEAWSPDPERAPGGIELWNIEDPTDPALQATIDPPPTPDPSREGVWTTAHNFDIANDRLYSSWYQGGIKIHDLSDPSSPRELTWWRRPSTTRFWAARAGDNVLIASSMGVDEASPRLYLFPDCAGTQANPPTLTPPATPGEPPIRNTPFPLSPQPVPTEQRSPSPSRTHTESTTPSVTESDVPPVPLSIPPGTNIGILFGLIAAAWWRRFRSG